MKDIRSGKDYAADETANPESWDNIERFVIPHEFPNVRDFLNCISATYGAEGYAAAFGMFSSYMILTRRIRMKQRVNGSSYDESKFGDLLDVLRDIRYKMNDLTTDLENIIRDLDDLPEEVKNESVSRSVNWQTWDTKGFRQRTLEALVHDISRLCPVLGGIAEEPDNDISD